MAEETKKVAKVYDIQTIKIRDEKDMKAILNANYRATLENYLGDAKAAAKFMSAMVSDTQRNPTLLECTPPSLFNSYMMMASCGFMPSAVSQEAYILPYNNSKKVGNEWIKVKEAQFQIGYQGLVTLFYKAGIQKIVAQNVHENDDAELVNGTMVHKVPLGMSKEKRGKAIGTYVTITFRGQDNTMYMNGEDIMAHGKKFSKSFDPVGKHSPWNPENDPELTMWKKTVLKQMSKFLPKNETIHEVIAADNSDSKMHDRIEQAKGDKKKLQMGNLELDHGEKLDQEQDAAVQAASGDETQENRE